MKSNTVTVLEKRIASRAISTEKLSEEVLSDLAEAARLTPSCYNKQPWRFLFLESDGARARAAEVLVPQNLAWAGRAPLIIIGYSSSANDCVLPDGREYHQFDLGMSVMNILLAATEHSLVARPMAGFNPDKARELFGLGPEDRPMIVIAVGKKSDDESHLPGFYKDLDSKSRERKPVAEVVKRL
ncbi:MAG: nitroreductase family protein [Myxococcota bacterium]|jgi:nitroreductase